ncbi:hypothetical protein ACFYPC_11920 [Streptomyces sp. NPDC005808]|uniref:hypothetical protein n=1 Tax=Streptomyces sp. NPDC005808 TaxID=3364734 RepID=UPI0036C98DCF
MSEDGDGVEVSDAPEEPEWLAWLVHVRTCTGDCRVRGRDCPTAGELREALRKARALIESVTPR